jgi:hypothetical protein
MTRFIEFMISMLIVIVLFLVIGLFLPSKRNFVYSIETNRPMATVNDLLNGFSRFKDWNPLVHYDARMTTEVSGPPMGIGAKFSYHSQQRLIGDGSWTISESVPGEKIVYTIDSPARGSDKQMIFTFERTGQRNQNVKITQEYKVNYGWDLLGRYAGLYVSRNVGDDLKRGLDRFSNFLATIPKFDYGQHQGEFVFADMPAQDLLFVTTGAKRDNDAIATQMTNQQSWIKKVMDSNGLVAAGPLRIVTNEFTGTSYGFDVVMPVRKGSGAPAADTEAAAPAAGSSTEAAAAAADVPPVAAGAPLEIKLEGPVKYLQQPARRVAMTTYSGPAPGLPQQRDILRAWVMTHGADTQDRPYEEYLGGIATMLDEDAKFKVYWPVKK